MNKRSTFVEKTQWFVLPALATLCATAGAWAFDHEKIKDSDVIPAKAPLTIESENTAGPSWVIYRKPIYIGGEYRGAGLGQKIKKAYVMGGTSTLVLDVEGNGDETESHNVKFTSESRALTAMSRLSDSMKVESGLSLDLSGCVRGEPVYSTHTYEYNEEGKQVRCEVVHTAVVVECSDSAWTFTPLTQINQRHMMSESPKSANPIFSHETKCPRSYAPRHGARDF